MQSLNFNCDEHVIHRAIKFCDRTHWSVINMKSYQLGIKTNSLIVYARRNDCYIAFLRKYIVWGIYDIVKIHNKDPVTGINGWFYIKLMNLRFDFKNET